MRQIDKQYEAIDESKGLFWKEPTDNLMVHIAQPYVLYNRRHMRFLKSTSPTTELWAIVVSTS